MYPVWVMGGIFFVWACILTLFIWRQNNFLKSTFAKSGERDIRKKFEELLQEIGDFRIDLVRLERKAQELEIKGLEHIQRVELLRFNPYDDTGGDQSFVIALLNDKGSGIVINSLHARSGTRIFAKEVVEGKPHKYKFSLEEEKVVKKALENI